MFERKNQSILSKHFNKMVDRDSDHGDDDSDDDFITLKRADHELEGDSQEHTFVSKRQEKLAGTKKAVTKYGTRGTKLVFDDEGEAHELYEMKSAEEVFKGADEVKEAGRKFAESERSRLKDADVLDKAEAKEKKREKKRKRKEREREVREISSNFVFLAIVYMWYKYGALIGVTLFHRERDTTTAKKTRVLWAPQLRSCQRTTATYHPNLTYRRSRKTRSMRGHLRPRSPARMPHLPCLRSKKRRSWRCRCCGAGGDGTIMSVRLPQHTLFLYIRALLSCITSDVQLWFQSVRSVYAVDISSSSHRPIP